jgi:glutathione peroxidase
MKKTLLTLSLGFFLAACNHNSVAQDAASENIEDITAKTEMTKSFYDFKVIDINGEDFDLSSLKGKRVLVVNTASECGYTPQYKSLQELYEKHGGDKFTVIGFPCNQFGGQEPGSNEEIKSFCEKNFGVSFPMMDKVNVKGDAVHPLYDWLTEEDLNGVDGARVSWNFNKFLIDENGNWVAHHGSSKSPMSDEIIAFATGK